MKKQTTQLRDERGNHFKWLCLAEAERLESEGKARRISRLKERPIIFQMRWFPEPSTSPESSAAITFHQMQVLAGEAGFPCFVRNKIAEWPHTFDRKSPIGQPYCPLVPA